MKSCFDGWSPQVIDSEDKAAVIAHLEKYRFAIVTSEWEYNDTDFQKISALYSLGRFISQPLTVRNTKRGYPHPG
nr:hypothetical protein PJ912_01045 [Pectobacterium colocasium]